MLHCNLFLRLQTRRCARCTGFHDACEKQLLLMLHADESLFDCTCAAIIRTKLSEAANLLVQPYGVPVAVIVQANSSLS